MKATAKLTLVFLIIYEFNKSLGDIMKEFFVKRVCTHNLVDFPVALKGFDHLYRSFYNTLNVGKFKLVSSETINTWQTISFSLIFLSVVLK